MIFKCKMCGGTLEVTEGASVAECPYCGAKQTLPKLDNERRANLYDRAGHFRLMSDFDKAMALYEEILKEDSTDAEAYWSIVLCRYGIEYVEDPATHRRIPTINRVQLTSILADEDYKSALAYADGYQRKLYEAEAKEIEEIQKGILAISDKEEPFDIFICYKETDEGVRTRDCVLANDLYYELTNEGYKVFFSRITLEDKLGTAYEPYIFAALRSARVMVVVGTKAENFNAPWVKNEWSRYLALIRAGEKKTLIPAYRDMDPYDLPDAFSHLQAQDMSKLGFMQDLTRGIKKLLATGEKKTVVTEVQCLVPSTGVVQFLKRARVFLEDGDWKAADEYIEHALDSDPEDAEAYLLKLLVALHLRSENVLSAYNTSVAGDPNYIKALRYSKGERHKQIAAYETQIQENIRNRTYQKAQDLYNVGSYSEARSVFLGLGNYKDSMQRAATCIEAEKADSKHQYDETWLVSAIETLDTIIDYAPAAELRQTVQAQLNCLTEMRREREEQERRRLEEAALYAKREAELRRIRADKMRQKSRNFFKWAIPIATVVAILLVLAFNWWIPAAKYSKAEKLVSERNYTAAAKLLQDIRPGFRDCDARLNAITTIREMDLTSGRNLVDGITYLLSLDVPVKITYETAGGVLQSGEAVRLMASSNENDAFGTATEGRNAVCFYQNNSDFSGLETVARDGYQFLAWEYVAASLDFSGTEDFATVTLRAAWTANAYSLSFRLDGGDAGETLPTQYGAESEDITISQPTKKGYTFIGWTGTGLSEPVKEFCIPTGSWGNRSYTAVWQVNTYTLTLDANGGSCDSKTVFAVYGRVLELPMPVWSGHTFSGWYCGTKEYSSDIYTEDDDLTLTAAWDLIQYPVIYRLSGGENAANNVSQYTVLTGLSLSAPTRKGYSFAGWTYAGQDTPEPNVVFPAGTVGAWEFTAVWQANHYTLTLEADGGLCDTKSVFAVFDAPVELPTPSRAGYEFLGWYNGQVLYNGENWTLDGGATLVARWKARTDVTYRVEHYQQDAVGDGYTRTAEQLFTGTADNAVTPATNTYTGFITPATKTITIAPDGSLIVKYYYTREVYTATAVVNGGGPVPTRTARYQAPLTMDVPVRNGFTFGGWYTDANLTKAWNGSLSDHTTLFACWSEETRPCDLGYTGQTGANGYEIIQYTGTSVTLWIPAYIGGTPVTAIADHAFDANTQLAKIVIPDAVTSIGEGAFSQCVAVTEAILPVHAISFIPQFALENVTISSGTDIPGNAFKECRTLSSIILPSELKTIGSSAFLCCSSLTDIRIPDSVDTIGESAFAASGLTNIALPLKLTSISKSLFNGCNLLQTVSINDHVTEIGQYAFYQCKSLLSVPLSTKLTSVGDYAFYGCEKIADISLPDSLKTIGSVAFGKCKEVRHICVPDAVVSIGIGAFSGCEKTKIAEIPAMAVSALPKTALESVTITSGDSIAYSSFEDCKTLTSVIMADSVTDIGGAAFFGCTTLKSLRLGNSTVSIGTYAFSGCSSLTCITIPDSTTTIAANAFEKVNLVTVTLPTSAIQSIPKTALKSVTITSGESIEKSAFANCITLEYIAVADSVTTIDAYAFSGCSSLKSITMPDGVLSLGEYVFANCTALEQITIADSVTTIGAYAFNGCTGLISVHLSMSIDTISSCMFYGCSRLTDVTIPAGVLSIGMNAFADCVSLEMVELTDGLQTIMYGAFQNCSALTSIVIPDSVTIIGESIFSGCLGLKSMTFPYVWGEKYNDNDYQSVRAFGYVFGTTSRDASKETIIGYGGRVRYYFPSSLTQITVTSGKLPDGAFSNCSMLTSVTLNEAIDEYDAALFSGCANLTEVFLPSNMTSIPNSMFSDNTSLSTIVLPQNVTAIGNCAFENCINLTSIVIPNGVTSLGASAFNNCQCLASVTLPETLTNIGNLAFAHCFGLVSVVILGSVKSIDNTVFRNCSALATIILPESVIEMSADVFNDTALFRDNSAWDNGVLYVGRHLICTKAEDLPSAYSVRNGTLTIAGSAFSGCSGLTEIIIPDDVRYVSSFAFANCENIEVATVSSTSILCIPKSALRQAIITSGASIPDSSFSGAKFLTTVSLPDSVMSIGASAFSGCQSLTDIILPKNLTAIGRGAFYQCTKLTSIKIPDGVVSIGNSSFRECTELDYVELPNGLTSIGTYTFQSCKLKNITLPDTVVSIGAYAFQYCRNLVQITVPSGVETIGDSAFEYCTNLIEVYNLSSLVITKGSETHGYIAYYARNVYTPTAGSTSITTTIDGYRFYEDDSISYLLQYIGEETDLVLPQTSPAGKKYEIASRAFYGMHFITSVTISSGVTKIGTRAFADCLKLHDVTMEDGVERIGGQAFWCCSSLDTVTISARATLPSLHPQNNYCSL